MKRGFRWQLARNPLAILEGSGYGASTGITSAGDVPAAAPPAGVTVGALVGVVGPEDVAVAAGVVVAGAQPTRAARTNRRSKAGTMWLLPMAFPLNRLASRSGKALLPGSWWCSPDHPQGHHRRPESCRPLAWQSRR